MSLNSHSLCFCLSQRDAILRPEGNILIISSCLFQNLLPFCSSSLSSRSLLPARLSFDQSFPLETHPRLVNRHLTPPTLHYSSKPHTTPTPPGQTQWKVLPRYPRPHTGRERSYNNTSVLILFVIVGLCWLRKPTTAWLYGTSFAVSSHSEEPGLDTAKGFITCGYSSWHLPRKKPNGIVQITHYLYCNWTWRPEAGVWSPLDRCCTNIMEERVLLWITYNLIIDAENGYLKLQKCWNFYNHNYMKLQS